jgi:chemotaxis protein MotB
MKKIFLFVLSSFVFTACVSPKIHKELQAKYQGLELDNTNLRAENDSLKAGYTTCADELKRTKADLEITKQEYDATQARHDELQGKYRELNKNYEFLLENNNALMASNQAENKKLIDKLNTLQKDLHAKEDSLTQEQQKLEYLSKELQKREARVYELESLIAEQDRKVNEVRETLKKALFDFDGKGLTVEMRDGKVYVSLENSLLFPSASWAVEPRGKKALEELAKVLANNKDLNVMVEGHTDADAFRGQTAVKDNWDLSVMRATSIVKVLTSNKEVNPARITAAGRSEYVPIATNETSEGKAKNRRTEIIITPDLDKIVKVLGEVK